MSKVKRINMKSQFFVSLLLIILCGCKENTSKIWLPVLNNQYSNIIEIENAGVESKFVKDNGYVISLDSLYFKDGLVYQDVLYINYPENEQQDLEFKSHQIHSVYFHGDSIDLNKFGEIYSLTVDAKKDSKYKDQYYYIRNKKSIIGDLTVYKNGRYVLNIGDIHSTVIKK